MAIEPKKDLRTTVAGFVIGLGIILAQVGNLIDTDPLTVFSWSALVVGLAAIGLGWFSKDK